jgi:hypothetical protein
MPSHGQFVYRKVYFYRIEHPEQIVLALPGDLARIGNLPFTEAGRYDKDGDEGRLCVWPDSFEFPLKLRFGRTRLRNLPTKELGGKLEELGLAAGEGLAELMHIVIFEDGYVAAEFNFEAPRISRLGPYLYNKRNKLTTKPVFLPLFQRDILQLVRDMPAISFLELKGKPDAKSLLEQADGDLAGAFGTIADLGADRSVELGLRAQKQPDSKLKKLSAKLAHLAQRYPWDVRTTMTKLRITGITTEGKLDVVDLLEDQLIVVKQMEKASRKHKAVLPASAYKELIVAYREKKDELGSAIAGRMLT